MAVAQDHTLDVGVSCDPTTVRLRHGGSRQMGVLEVYHNGQWGNVCNHGFGAREANVTCVQLGFDGGFVVYDHRLQHPDDNQILWLDEVMCQGHGTSFGELGGRDVLVGTWLISATPFAVGPFALLAPSALHVCLSVCSLQSCQLSRARTLGGSQTPPATL